MKKFSKIKKVLAGAILTATLTTGIGSSANAASLNGISVNSWTQYFKGTVAIQNSNAYPVTTTLTPNEWAHYQGQEKWFAYTEGTKTITLQPKEKTYVTLELIGLNYFIDKYYKNGEQIDYWDNSWGVQVHSVGHTYSGNKDLGTFMEKTWIEE